MLCCPVLAKWHFARPDDKLKDILGMKKQVEHEGINGCAACISIFPLKL
jgi:hypothetical protein